MPAADEKPTCFIAMPITTHEHEAERYGGDLDHWIHVMETIFVPAIERAGFEAIRPAAKGSHMIHGQIIKHLSSADMVLCDLSSHNPNVFFELGVRTSLNLPIALVKDEHLNIPFDTSGINTHSYDSALNGWDIQSEVVKLAAHLEDSVESCDGRNPMWRHFGLTIAADGPSGPANASDAQLALMFEDMSEMRREMQLLSKRTSVRDETAPEASNPHTSSRVKDLAELGVDLSLVLGLPYSSGRRKTAKTYSLTFDNPTKAVISPSHADEIETALRRRGFALLQAHSGVDELEITIRSS
ncbi:hypothetical protein [Microbacterium sp. NPDC089188]|uniref:hypothetical protein n=1 Tax=Microbacterium sp. NPDC089188 TaxID=3154971 RepID=UPI0034206E59